MKRFFLSIIIPLIVFCLFYLVAEKLLIGKIKNDIESSLGTNYAILALHVAGENSHRPILWKMLKKAIIYELNVNGEYSPKGTGRYTGKRHHLAILISNNEKIFMAEWSFRSLGLILGDFFAPWDFIENLPEDDKRMYTFDLADIKNREGLNYKDTVLNDDEKVSFYYRHTKPGTPGAPEWHQRD